jgi:NAD(P)-dependent dehydrogenase (short-subunit alcohol dehydrogenase family)
VAVVTGAGRGIGRGCALALGEAGADVVAVSRTETELADLVEEVARAGGLARAVVCDVTDAAQVGETIGAIETISILVNAAGTNIPEPFLEVTEGHLDSVVNVNLKGTFLVSQAAVRRMVGLGDGAIVNISSQMGHVGAEKRTVYCATKHAVEGLTKALAIELAPSGVRVNAVAPTFIETPMTEGFFADSEFRRSVEDRIPLGRIGSVNDVAGAVVFLASPSAALITGASLLVDGGWTAQ